MAALWIVVTGVEASGIKDGDVQIGYRALSAGRSLDGKVYLSAEASIAAANDAIKADAQAQLRALGVTFVPADQARFCGAFDAMPL